MAESLVIRHRIQFQLLLYCLIHIMFTIKCWC